MLTSVVRLIRLCRFCRRGHADAEIEAVFAKYDLDGDRILDEEEQRKMQEDLEGQKVRFLVHFGLNSSTSLLFWVSSFDNAFQDFFDCQRNNFDFKACRWAFVRIWGRNSSVDLPHFRFCSCLLSFYANDETCPFNVWQLFGSIDNHTTVDYE